jgi:hypothetical protein
LAASPNDYSHDSALREAVASYSDYGRDDAPRRSSIHNDGDYDVNGGSDYGASHEGVASSPLAAAGVAAATLLDQSSASSLGAATPWASGDYSAEVAEVDAEVKRATEELTGAIGELRAFR